MQFFGQSDITSDRFTVLRLGRDWQEILYSQNIHYWVSCGICGAAAKDTLAIDGTGARWIFRTAGTAIVLQTEGWYVRIDVSGRDRKPNEYPVRIQVQGHAFANADDIETRLSAIERYLWPDDPPLRFPSRVDIAADIWIREGSKGQPSAAELARSLHRAGRPLDALRFDWSTHTRTAELDARLKGRIGVETFYLGNRSRALIRCYRKDVAFEGNTAAAYAAMWSARGYDGSGAVLRIEAEIHRDYFRKHGDEKSGSLISEMSWDDYTAHLRTLWISMLNTFSWRPGIGRIDRRPESDLWLALRAEPVADVPADARSAFVRIDRIGQLETLVKSVQAAAWRAQEALGDREANRIIFSALDARASPRLLSIRKEWAKRSRWTGFHKRTTDHEKADTHERFETETASAEGVKIAQAVDLRTAGDQDRSDTRPEMID